LKNDKYKAKGERRTAKDELRKTNSKLFKRSLKRRPVILPGGLLVSIFPELMKDGLKVFCALVAGNNGKPLAFLIEENIGRIRHVSFQQFNRKLVS